MADHLGNEPLPLDGELERMALAMAEDLRRRLNVETGLSDAMLTERAGSFFDDVRSRLRVSAGLTAVIGNVHSVAFEPLDVAEERPSVVVGQPGAWKMIRRLAARVLRRRRVAEKRLNVTISAVHGLVKVEVRSVAALSGSRDGALSGRSVGFRSAPADTGGPSFANTDHDDGDFRGRQLDGANFSGASLVQADFTEAKLSGANFERANLLRAIFRGADLSNAYLARANINGIDIRGANMISASFELEDLDGVRWDNETQWSPEDLAELKKVSSAVGDGEFVASVPPDSLLSGARRNR